MKNILDYINEELLDDKVQSLLDFIKNKNVDNYEDSINKLYNTYKKISRGSINSIRTWIDEYKNDGNVRHMKTFKMGLFSLCEEYSCYEELTYIAEQQSKGNKDAFIHIDFEKFITSIDLNYIVDYYNNFIKGEPNLGKIPADFWKDLYSMESAGQPVVGSGEFLLKLISEQPKEKVKGLTGDVIINNHGVEVKNLCNDEARLGNSDKGNCVTIFSFLNEINNNIKSKTISKDTKDEELLGTINSLHKFGNKEKLTDILKDKIRKSFYYNREMTEDAVNKYTNVIEETINYLCNIEGHNNFKEFIRIFTALYMIIYCNEEGAEYLCTIKKSGNDMTFNFIHMNLSKETLLDLLDARKFDMPSYRIRYSSGKNSIMIKYE